MKNMIHNNNCSLIYKFFLGAFLLILSTSCRSKDEIIYYKNIEANVKQFNNKINTTFKVDDLLIINVNTETEKASEPFNLPYIQYSEDGISAGRRQQQTYLVSKNGTINLPLIGDFQLLGKSKELVIKELKEKLSEYVKNPIVNIRIVNYKFTVNGEVKKPNTYFIKSERITLPEALTMAGDLTIYGKRKNILIIREDNGIVKTHRVDMTNSDFINTEYYYIKQNDIIYVEPNKVKVNASAVGTNTSVIISAVTLLTTVISLLIR